MHFFPLRRLQGCVKRVSVPCWALRAVPSPAGFTPAALAACGDSDDSRWRATLCSRRIFLPENRHWEPDPRTAGPPWQERGQQQPGQGLGDTTATVSPPGTALPAAQGLGGLCPHSWFSGILDWRHHMGPTSLEPQFIPLGSSGRAEGADAQEHKIPKYSSGLS